MTVDVYANHPNPTHHVSLSDGVTTLGLIAVGQDLAPDALTVSRSPVDRNPLKTTTGGSTYSDLEYPYSVIAQDDWSGGRGLDFFEKDATRFYDSCGIWSDRGRLTLAGKVYFGEKDVVKGYDLDTGITIWFPNVDSSPYAGFWTIPAVTNPVLYIYAEFLAATATLKVSDDTHTFNVTVTAPALNDAQWIKITLPSLPAGDFSFRCDDPNMGIAGSQDANRVIFRLIELGSTSDIKYFEYKEQMYFAQSNKVYMNGDRGACDANTGQLGKLIDASKSWTTNEWVGCVAKLIVSASGSAGDEPQMWRLITGNDATSLTVSPAWTIEQGTAQNYVILGSSKWTEILSLAAPILSVGVTKGWNDGIVYFALGSLVNMRRFRSYNNAGTWTNEDADDGTNKARYLQLVYDATAGWEIWRATQITAAKASIAAWGTALTFGTAISLDSRINGVQAYADNSQAETLWIFTEGGPWYIQSGKAIRLPLREFDAVRGEKTGAVSAVFGTNLYFSFENGLERYYDSILDDVGPNLGEGFPINRRGPITALAAYPGRLFAAVSAEASGGYSCVLEYNGGGWHEIFRYPEAITSLFIQTVPGVNRRLWIGAASGPAFMVYPLNGFNPLQFAGQRYHFDGSIVTGWITTGLADVYKYFKTLKLFFSNDESADLGARAYYRIHEDDEWTQIGSIFDDSPISESIIGTRGINAKKIQVRVRLFSKNTSKTPILRASILEAVTVSPTKYSYSFSVFLKTNGLDLRGNIDANSLTTIAKLDEWIGTAKPLQMRCVHPLYDNVDIFLMPSSLRGVSRTSDNGEFGYFMSILLQEA